MKEISLELPVIADGSDKSSIIKNCIRNNYRHIRKWAKRTNTNCFRIYNRDIKEYPLVIDFYAGKYLVQYFSYDREVDEPSDELKDEMDKTLSDIFCCSLDNIYWRSRVRRKRTEQYEKLDDQKEFFQVFEYGIKFIVNLSDYLDSGLFLDHRETRKFVLSMVKDKRVLNLFSYTCSFSVYAAVGGAKFTKSIDMSNIYTYWGRKNFDINELSEKDNEIIREDCIKFLDKAHFSLERFDIIIIDPPTISRSKKMTEMFDVQKDYLYLINRASRLLNKDGVIFFSTNYKKFKLDESKLQDFSIEDMTSKTIPIDFRNRINHKCYKISLKKESTLK